MTFGQLYGEELVDIDDLVVSSTIKGSSEYTQTDNIDRFNDTACSRCNFETCFSWIIKYSSSAPICLRVTVMMT